MVARTCCIEPSTFMRTIDSSDVAARRLDPSRIMLSANQSLTIFVAMPPSFGTEKTALSLLDQKTCVSSTTIARTPLGSPDAIIIGLGSGVVPSAGHSVGPDPPPEPPDPPTPAHPHSRQRSLGEVQPT